MNRGKVFQWGIGVMFGTDIKRRLDEVRANIEGACRRRGRSPEEVKLVAVSKRFPAEVVEEAARAGQMVFGENYVQEAVAKIESLKDRVPSLEWHLIGHLQKNKVKPAVTHFDWIETIDSLALLERVERYATKVEKVINCLIQVNISLDPGKAGILPEELAGFLSRAIGGLRIKNVRLLGLMTITKYSEDPEEARPWFRKLRELRDRVVDDLGGEVSLPHLSMGMSNDYPVAIEEGATIVRVGQAIFGPRPRP